MSNSICRFYLQGTCRYGNRCKFRHEAAEDSYDDSYYSNPRQDSSYSRQDSSYSRQDPSYYSRSGVEYRYEDDPYEKGDYYYNQRGSYSRNQHSNRDYDYGPSSAGSAYTYHSRNQPNQRQTALWSSNQGRGKESGNYKNTTSSANEEDIVEIVKNEVNEWIHGKQWLLSCFSPIKTFNMPGLIDISPEELRTDAYKAKDTGKQADYESYVNSLNAKAQETCNQLRNPSGSIKQLLEKLKRGEIKTDVSSSAPSPAAGGINFGVPPAQPVVNATPAMASFSFRLNQPSQSPSSVLSTASSASIFGGGTTTTASVFGTPSGSIFGTPATSSSVFGTAVTAAGSPSVFGAPASIFGAATVSSSAFGGAPASTSSSIFGASTADVSFGQAVPQQTNVSSSSTSKQLSGLYTALQDLTDKEKEAFSAVEFVTIREIPTRPPASELCR